MDDSDYRSALTRDTPRLDHEKRLELGLWLFLWVSLVAAARTVWVGRTDFLSFEVATFYLWAGWIATFAFFLVPRARAAFASVHARRRIAIAALAFMVVALTFGRVRGDTCGLGRLPGLLFNGSQLRRWLEFTPPRFSRCRTLPTAIIGSLIGWFIGFQIVIALERRSRQPLAVAPTVPIRPIPTRRGDVILASTKISTAQKISVAKGTAPQTASAKCRHCETLLPAAPEAFVGRCRSCGSGYRIVRAGAMLIAAAYEDA